MKVIYLAFANSEKEMLASLSEEEAAVYNMLTARSLSGGFIVDRQPYATPENINEALQKYRDNLAIFHYSGHAGNDKLLVNDEIMYAKGIADQLKYSVNKKVLKMVVLNGCSTAGQVEALEKIGVPIIVSTSAKVKDKSAKEFSIYFWRNLLAGMTVKNAFEQSLEPANVFTAIDTTGALVRAIGLDEGNGADDAASLWELHGSDFELSQNPIPLRPVWDGKLPVPNVQLIETLFQSFQTAGSPDICYLWERQQRNEIVGNEVIVSALINNMPITIGLHLQKLLSVTITENDPAVLRKFWKERIFQIGQLYQTTTEFFGIVLMAQIWELHVKFGDFLRIDDKLKSLLSEYLGLSWEKRKVYNYMKLVQSAVYFLRERSQFPENIRQFVEKQEILSDLYNLDEEFMESCDYLTSLRVMTVNDMLDENQVESVSAEVEANMCRFMKPLGFIHKYNLCSIQKIDIMKFKHIQREKAEYLHKIVKCMQVTTDEQYNYYYMPSYVDNWSVMLIKFKVDQIINREKRIYRVTPEDYLNLSPFVIDKNAFVDKANLSYIMFFKEMDAKTNAISYQWVKRPMTAEDSFPVEDEQMNQIIRLQLDAFAKLTQ